MSTPQTPRRTPLYECHLEAGASLIEFAGWEMPRWYSGQIEEHRAVRAAAGLFDVSHMGEVLVRGAGAEEFLQRLTPNDVTRLRPGRAHYSGLLTEEGTYLDDLLVYRLEEQEFLLVVNAANREKDFAWIESHAPNEVEVRDVSDDYALLALQGPEAASVLRPLTPLDLDTIRYYRFARGAVDGRAAIVSRTGYTGEDGFEIYVAPEAAAPLWRRLLAAGAGAGLVPAGLGARDTLRLEAGMALYGHELDEATTPVEAGLEWVVAWEKGEFIGRQALAAQKRRGVGRSLTGFEVTGRGIAREGCVVRVGEKTVGRVTSGTWSPTFEKALGMAYVSPETAAAGGRIEIEVRGKPVEGAVVGLPFYARRGARKGS